MDDFSTVKCTYRKMKRILEGKALIHHSDSWVGRGKKPFSVDGLVLLWTLSLMEKRLCFSFGNNVCQKREKFAFLAATPFPFEVLRKKGNVDTVAFNFAEVSSNEPCSECTSRHDLNSN